MWNEDDSKNIESLVLEMKNEKKVDNTKLLLDVIPRSALGYEFSLEKVNIHRLNILKVKIHINYQDLTGFVRDNLGREIFSHDHRWS